MKSIVSSFFLLRILILPFESMKAQSAGLVPLPDSVQWLGDSVLWEDIGYKEDAYWKETGTMLVDQLPVNKGAGDTKWKLHLDLKKDLKSEAYQIAFRYPNITLSAASAQGLMYGVQTLKQMTKGQGKNAYLMQANIIDAPRFPYRGLHLDTGRHFFDKSFIFDYLDMMARYKLNVFHWHLTEDQGWRIEIKKYPKLQSVAAWRKKTLIGHAGASPKKYDELKYGGFYTHEDIKEVVAYAAKLGIEVIPEIEMPGHASAAIAAYPELGCTGNTIDVVGDWGVFDDVFCPTEITFGFLEDVLTEVMTLFPSSYIHIGGDECPKIQWKNNPYCQQLIKDNGLVDEHGLQSYFIKRIEKFVNRHGKKIIGWDEILEGGLAPNATVMSWRGIEGGMAAAMHDHPVIMTPTDYCYLDYHQSKSPNEPLAIGGFLPLEKVYSYDPVPSDLPASKRHYILGTQGNVWTEYLDSPERVWYQVLPRMTALAEVGWTDPGKKNFSDYLARLDDHYRFWKEKTIPAADKRYELFYEISKPPGRGIDLRLSTKAKKNTIRVYKDENQVKDFTGTMSIKESCRIKAESAKEPANNFLEFDIQWHKAAGQIIEMGVLPDDRYKAFGPVTLCDGIQGKKDSHKEGWMGFNKKDLNFTVHFEETETVETIELNFYHNPNQWIHCPKVETLRLWCDGKPLPIADIKINVEDNVHKLVIGIHAIKGKTIQLEIPNKELILDGMPGEGNTPWVFIDEIKVR